MKIATRIVIFTIITLFLFEIDNACSISSPPLRKQFRQSANVFMGEVLDITETPKDYKDKKKRFIGGIVKFKIEKSWKGTKETEISLLSDIINTGCGEKPQYFTKGEKYLVFTEKDYVYFYESSKLAYSNDKIKKLDDFGFRLWARIYPF